MRLATVQSISLPGIDLGRDHRGADRRRRGLALALPVDTRSRIGFELFHRYAVAID
ncbi:MAG TPA: hypothetical protein VE755_00750 [Myxococcales bacterium]|nr:hypothetical protein [Myxococcales bacterium]